MILKIFDKKFYAIIKIFTHIKNFKEKIKATQKRCQYHHFQDGKRAQDKQPSLQINENLIMKNY